ADSGGGMIAVCNGRVLAHVQMPIAGLMSDQSLHTVVREVEALEKAWQHLGCPLHAPFMTFSLIALPVIPDIRITKQDIDDVNAFRLVETEIHKLMIILTLCKTNGVMILHHTTYPQHRLSFDSIYKPSSIVLDHCSIHFFYN